MPDGRIGLIDYGQCKRLSPVRCLPAPRHAAAPRTAAALSFRRLMRGLTAWVANTGLQKVQLELARLLLAVERKDDPAIAAALRAAGMVTGELHDHVHDGFSCVNNCIDSATPLAP